MTAQRESLRQTSLLQAEIRAHRRTDALLQRQLTRFDEEMAEARRQQLSMVPDVFPSPDAAHPVRVHAVMIPAFEVGHRIGAAGAPHRRVRQRAAGDPNLAGRLHSRLLDCGANRGHGGSCRAAAGRGLCEITLSRFLRRLRGVFSAGPDWLAPLAVAVGTLAVMVGCSVGGRRRGRAGGAAAPPARITGSAADVPREPAAPALVTGIAVTLNSIGALTAAQRLADADWKRQDMDGLGRGLLADGLGTMAAAMVGGAGISSASSVGLAANARATSPAIGYAVAAGFLAMAVVPRFAQLVLGVPLSVLGAALVYLSCSLLVGGISIMSSRLLDARKTFTLGIAFVFAAATPALTRAGSLLPHWMAPIMTSPLLAAALVALLLNPLLRLGIRQQVRLSVPPEGLGHAALQRFVTHAGAAWGARREVMARAEGAIAECLDTLSGSDLVDGPIELVLGFNELALDTRLAWRGRPLVLSSTRPTKQELLHDEDAAARLAGYMIARVATRVRMQFTDGVAELHLTFAH